MLEAAALCAEGCSPVLSAIGIHSAYSDTLSVTHISNPPSRVEVHAVTIDHLTQHLHIVSTLVHWRVQW